MNKDVLGRFSDARILLLEWMPFFGHLLLKLNGRSATPEVVPTMGVTRDRLVYMNEEWCSTLTDPQFRGVVLHELLHVVYRVFQRQGSRNIMVRSKSGQVFSLWNIAHDYAINAIIEEARASSKMLQKRIELPQPCCYDKRFDGMSAEEIYDILADEIPPSPAGGGEGGEGEASGEDYGWGVGDLRDDLAEDEGGSGKGAAGQDGPEGRGGGRSPAQTDQLDRFWEIAVLEAAQVHESRASRGTLPAGIQRLLDEIRDPRVPWADVLSQWVGEHGRKQDFSYRRPSRRAAALNLILPGVQNYGVDDIVVFWDTSGSMSGRETEILSEVIGICDDLHLTLRVICVDAEIHSDQSDVSEPEDVDVLGGGGSDFRPAFDRLVEEEYEGVVVAFTDGYIGVPEVKPTHIREVLWVIWEGDVHPTEWMHNRTWGQAIRIGEDGCVSRR